MLFTKGILTVFVVGFVGVLCNCALFGSEAKEKEDATKTEGALVAYWSFDEGDGTTARDKSGNGHDAVFLPDHEPKWVDGFIGKALEFKQSGLEVKNSRNLNPAHFTIEAWIKLSENSTGQQEILCKGVDSLPSSGFRLRNFHTMLQLRLNFDGKQISCSTRGKGMIPRGAWTHVAGVYDGQTAKVLINGEVVAEEDTPAKIQANSLPMFIGVYVGGKTYHFDGIIDELRLYSMAKSQEEILADMFEQAKAHKSN